MTRFYLQPKGFQKLFSESAFKTDLSPYNYCSNLRDRIPDVTKVDHIPGDKLLSPWQPPGDEERPHSRNTAEKVRGHV